MRIRLNTKGDIMYNIEQFFNDVSDEQYLDATSQVEQLRKNIGKHLITRDLDMFDINIMINGLQMVLKRGNGNNILKTKVCFDKMTEIIKSLEGADREKATDKWGRLKEIYEDLQEDVARFINTKKIRDVEAIKTDFRDIREMEKEFREDMVLYKRYQEVARQMGVCNAALIKLAYSGLMSDQQQTKLMSNFDFIFPKLEFLLASRLREKPEGHEGNGKSEEEIDVPEDQVNEVNYLSKDMGWNAEQIAEHTGLDQDIVNEIIFGGVDANN